ncbi:MAG: asparagine synthase (glutamine-hydrolyzing), partial [Casimicrobium sp.]
GIAGIFAYGATAPSVDRAELIAVRDHMAARGPDGVGEWLSSDHRVAFGHRRLSIIDLSDAGLQPMHSLDARYTLVFNGEIYNYRELRRELERDGVTFTSNSDSEVLLALYAREGEAMLAKLRGMFACAIYDHREQSLFLARDPFGIKPLYFADDGNTIRFASQVKALLFGRVDRSPEVAGRVGFFIWGSVPEPWTLYRGIRALPAGTSMRVRDGACEAPRVFASTAQMFLQAADHPARCSRDEAKEAIAAALRDSVAAHHIADVPVGAFLSAGMDSTLLAHLSPRTTTSALRTVTLGFDEFSGSGDDEVPLAELVAKSLNASHHTARIKQADFVTHRQDLLVAMDQPSIDGVNTWFVSRAASQAGLKVALSGVGGDELFASYPSFRDVPRMQRAVSRLGMLAAVGAPLRKLIAPIVSAVSSPKYASLLEYGGSAGGAYLLRRALYLPW